MSTAEAGAIIDSEVDRKKAAARPRQRAGPKLMINHLRLIASIERPTIWREYVTLRCAAIAGAATAAKSRPFRVLPAAFAAGGKFFLPIRLKSRIFLSFCLAHALRKYRQYKEASCYVGRRSTFAKWGRTHPLERALGRSSAAAVACRDRCTIARLGAGRCSRSGAARCRARGAHRLS